MVIERGNYETIEIQAATALETVGIVSRLGLFVDCKLGSMAHCADADLVCLSRASRCVGGINSACVWRVRTIEPL